jgi:glycerol-3-phosphate dehydrogenase
MYLGFLDVKIKRSDVLSAWSGIRPLITDPGVRGTSSLVRSHSIDVSPSKLLTITGGKWTTYRNMAYETIEQAIQEFQLNPTKKSDTKNILLVGSHGYTKTLYLKLIQQYGFDTEASTKWIVIDSTNMDGWVCIGCPAFSG